jgi:hypothetical protein
MDVWWHWEGGKERKKAGFVEETTTHILCTVTFFRQSRCFLDNVRKYSSVGQAANDNMAHAHCMLDKATKTHSEYGIFIPFSQQQCLHKRASVLRI